MKIEAIKTQNYAQKDPSKPCILLVEGGVYDLPDALALRVQELDGGIIIEDEVKEKPSIKVESSAPKVESKEEPIVEKTTRRKPGQTKK